MTTELNELLQKYRITRAEIAEAADVSRPLVSLVLKGERTDRRGIVSTAISLVEAAKAEEERNRRRIAALCGSAA